MYCLYESCRICVIYSRSGFGKVGGCPSRSQFSISTGVLLSRFQAVHFSGSRDVDSPMGGSGRGRGRGYSGSRPESHMGERGRGRRGRYSGSDPSLILEKEEEEGEDEARSVLTYEFSSESVSSLKLDKSMLVKHSVLNEGKLIPTARVTPSGKILVFSEVVFFYSSCGFELYDPADADGKWVKLPRLVPEGVRDDFWIYSFTFMNKSLLILKTECGVFSLDLSSSKEDWKPNGFYGAQYMPSNPGNGFVLIGNYLYLTPFWAYDIEEEIPSRFVFSTRSHSLASLPHSPFLPIGYNQCPSITLVDDYDLNPGDCRFCIVQTGVDCELVLDVYRCDLTECKKELAKYRKERKEYKEPWLPPPLPGTIKVKTFKIIDSDSTHGAYEFNLNSFSAFSLNSKYTSISI